MTKKLLIYDAENNLMMSHALKMVRIDICDSHTIIYAEINGSQVHDPFTIRLPFTLKSISILGDTVLVYWLNDFYAIIDA
jgi:hypothetical protein